jgi:hypothetical protein
MNVWHAALISSIVLLLVSIEELYRNIQGKQQIKGDIITLISAVMVLILALSSIYFNWFGGWLKVNSSIQYSLSSAGFVLTLQSVIRVLCYAVIGEIKEAKIVSNRGIIGVVVFLIGAIWVFLTGV